MIKLGRNQKTVGLILASVLMYKIKNSVCIMTITMNTGAKPTPGTIYNKHTSDNGQ
jgi:hypothetical protein